MTITSQLIELLDQDPSLTDIHLSENGPPWVRAGEGLAPLEQVLSSENMLIWLKEIRYPTEHPFHVLQKRNGTDDFAFTLGKHRLRINAFCSQEQLKLAIRRLPKEPIPFAQLRLPSQILTLADCPRGLYFVCGSAGAGKSTTLGSIIDHINRTRAAHILTLEDPIELLHRSIRSLITQRSVGPGCDTPSFAIGGRDALRENPDVLMFGEMRDHETITAALDAAKSGNLVLATLHANSCAEALGERLGSFFSGAERDAMFTTLGSVFVGCVAQIRFRDPQGNVVVAAEVLAPTTDVLATLRDEGQTNKAIALRQIMRTGSRNGHITMAASLVQLVLDGRISKSDALFYGADKEETQSLLMREGIR